MRLRLSEINALRIDPTEDPIMPYSNAMMEKPQITIYFNKGYNVCFVPENLPGYLFLRYSNGLCSGLLSINRVSRIYYFNSDEMDRMYPSYPNLPWLKKERIIP